uniref:Endosomal transmembrane epsin interactor 1 n=1 Tax=Laticauda laticaudata TaxID=8630 RepID=A0A8C5WNZ1_LATLA
MSLPVVLPGSCCPMARLSAVSEVARPCSAGAAVAATAASNPPPPRRLRWSSSGFRQTRPRPASLTPVASRLNGASSVVGQNPLPARPLLSLGLLQLMLGCSMVALSFGALSLSNSPQVKNSCPFWAGSSVNLFVLLSVICVLLNLAGFILGCQGAQFVSSVPRCDLVDAAENKICFCCEEFMPAKCTEKANALQLYANQSCSSVHLLLKKVLFALCALNALTTTVCLVAAALRYLQIFATRRSCREEQQVYTEEVEEDGHASDPDDFVPPAPPPSYFDTFYSSTPRGSCRMLGSDVIPLPHIYGARIKGVEVFCPLDPPPPYEAVMSQIRHEQEDASNSAVAEVVNDPPEQNDIEVPQGDENSLNSLSRETTLSPDASMVPVRTSQLFKKRSKSDPVLHGFPSRGLVLSCEAATQTDRKPQLATVILRKSLRAKAARSRPQSLIDYKSYIDTKLLVAKFLEQSSCNMMPDIHELVEDIKSVLKSDEEHMEEAITSASFLEQVKYKLLNSSNSAWGRKGQL